MLFAVCSATRRDDNISLSGETYILKINPDTINSQLSVLLLECFYCQIVSVILSSKAFVEKAEKSKMEFMIKQTEKGNQCFNLTMV